MQVLLLCLPGLIENFKIMTPFDRWPKLAGEFHQELSLPHQQLHSINLEATFGAAIGVMHFYFQTQVHT
jgi:hypothetical protein